MKFWPLVLFMGVFVAGSVAADNLAADNFAGKYAGNYIGMVAGATFVKTDSTTFRPLAVGVVVGHRLANGFGTELDLLTGITDDDKANVSTQLELQASGYLTYSGTFNRRAVLTLGAGYSTTKLDSSVQSSGFPGSQSFNGPTFLARLEEQLLRYPNIVLSLSYQHFYLDSDVSLRGASFGVSYGF
jgi:hypothetical protein